MIDLSLILVSFMLLVRVCLYCSWCPLYFGCSAYVVLLIDCSAIYCFLSFKVHFCGKVGFLLFFFCFLRNLLLGVFKWKLYLIFVLLEIRSERTNCHKVNKRHRHRAKTVKIESKKNWFPFKLDICMIWLCYVLICWVCWYLSLWICVLVVLLFDYLLSWGFLYLFCVNIVFWSCRGQ